MKPREDSYTTQITFREAASQSNALQEAEMMSYHARNRRGVMALFDGSRKAFHTHEQEMVSAWYRDEQESLELILSIRIRALREQLNLLLQQGGLYLRRQTAEVALQERKALTSQVADFLEVTMNDVNEMMRKAEAYENMPNIQRHYHRIVDRLLVDSEHFVAHLMAGFGAMLDEKL
jgi:hypothetical protein